MNSTDPQRRTIASIVVAFFCTCLPTTAIEDGRENRIAQAERYTKAVSLKKFYADMAKNMANSLPEDEREEFKAALTKHLDIAAFERETKVYLVKLFTAPELKALIDFLESDVGKSAMKKYGTYMAELSPAMEAEMMKAAKKARREQAEQGAGGKRD